MRKADIVAAGLGSKQVDGLEHFDFRRDSLLLSPAQVTALMTVLLERSSLQELIIEDADLSQVQMPWQPQFLKKFI